jgi:hypothetical protein
MIMFQDCVEVFVLPDGAMCLLDKDKRNPLYMDECPNGELSCDGDCMYYEEKRQ